MAKIPEQYLDRLRTAGLLVSEPFVSSHVAYPDGVIVAKPHSVAGHSLPGLRGLWDEWTGVMIDAPTLFLHCTGQKWIVASHDYTPGPGPGDLVNEWIEANEAVDDILDFYFGSSARMDVKRKAQMRIGQRAKSQS